MKQCCNCYRNDTPCMFDVQVHSGLCQDRNGPPSEHSNSAPTSPVAPLHHHPASPSDRDDVRPVDSDSCFNAGFPTNVLQHQFEQFKMVNNYGDPETVAMVSGSDWQAFLIVDILGMQMQGSAGHSSSSSASSSTGGLFMSTVQAHSHNRSDTVMGQEYVTVSSGNGSPFGRSEASGHYTSRNLPLSASSLMSSSSVPTLYSKSVISCAPSHYNSQSQRHAIHSPQTSDSIPEIVLTGESANALIFADF